MNSPPKMQELSLLCDLLYVTWTNFAGPDTRFHVSTDIDRAAEAAVIWLTLDSRYTGLEQPVEASRAVLLRDFKSRRGSAARAEFLVAEVTRVYKELNNFIEEQQCQSH